MIAAEGTTQNDSTNAVPKQYRGLIPWKKGQAPNPEGKNARVKLSRQFVNALQKDFEENGREAIERVRIEDTTNYLKIVASLLPKDVNINVKEGSALDGLTERELETLRETIARLDAGNRTKTIENESAGIINGVCEGNSTGSSSSAPSPIYNTEA